MSHALPPERERAGTRTSVIVLIVLLVALGLGGFGWTAGGGPMPLWATLVGASLLLVCGVAAVLLAVAGPQSSDDELDSEDGIQARGTDTSERDEPDGTGPAAVESPPSSAGVERMWLPLAARLRTLLLRQIQDVDALEHEVEDPVLLNGLFRVDHSTVQALRLAETVGVLGGQPVDRSTRDAVPVRAVVRAAISELERYTQVELSKIDYVVITPAAVDGLRHIVAELLDNATLASDPDGEPVVVRAVTIPNGVKITIRDHGLAPTSEAYTRLNTVLRGSVQLGEVGTDGRYGLAVVGVLCGRLGLSAELEPNQFGGTDATVVVPARCLISEQPVPAPSAAPEAVSVPQTQPAPRHRMSGQIPTESPVVPHRVGDGEPEPEAVTLPHGLTAAEAALDAQQRSPAADARPALPRRIPGQTAAMLPSAPEQESVVQRNAFDPEAIGQTRDLLTGRPSVTPTVPAEAPETPSNPSFPFFAPSQEHS